ncbi:MAG: hypothetical protein WAO15_24850, partial [Mycobacterium sp.]
LSGPASSMHSTSAEWWPTADGGKKPPTPQRQRAGSHPAAVNADNINTTSAVSHARDFRH